MTIQFKALPTEAVRALQRGGTDAMAGLPNGNFPTVTACLAGIA